MKNLIRIGDLTKQQILSLLARAEKMKKHPPKKSLEGKILASCFFEPSTRTRLSFESAMLKLGGEVIGFADGSVSSTKKGESLSDSIRVISSYCDLIVLRHPQEGAAQCAAAVSAVPVINGGDGSHEHPTQTLIDLFSIKESQKKLTGLKVGLAGDLRYSRAVHSLAKACALFDIRLYFAAPEELMPSPQLCQELQEAGTKFSLHPQVESIINQVDILYLTRLQRERIDENAFQSIKSHFTLHPHLLTAAKKNLKILHPLPRLSEIPPTIDHSPHAYYFQQASNALYVRMALLESILS